MVSRKVLVRHKLRKIGRVRWQGPCEWSVLQSDKGWVTSQIGRHQCRQWHTSYSRYFLPFKAMEGLLLWKRIGRGYCLWDWASLWRVRLTCIWKVINRDPNMQTSLNPSNVVERRVNGTQTQLVLILLQRHFYSFPFQFKEKLNLG